MKPFSAFFFAALCQLPYAVSAGQADAPAAVPQTVAVAGVQTSVEPAAASPGVRFRDLFLAARGNEGEESKPYRLSIEQRQHLREQLRGQGAVDPHNK